MRTPARTCLAVPGRAHHASPAQLGSHWHHRASGVSQEGRESLKNGCVLVTDDHQHCPTMIISPRGEVMAELNSGDIATIRTTIDLDEAADWYLGQRRQDIVKLSYQTGTP